MTEVLLMVAVGLLLLLVMLVAMLLMRRAEGGVLPALAVMQRELAAGQRAEVEALRGAMLQSERAVLERAEQGRFEAQAASAGLQTLLLREQGEQRVLLEAKLREMSEQAAMRLHAIQNSVNAQLSESVAKSVEGSFQRVLDQFAAVQKAMGDVQAVTGQIGDLKRIFTNVKSRGGWGEAQLRALLEDHLPEGGWEANRKLRADRDEVVEFVLVMPAPGRARPLLAIDAKFPVEDWDRLLLAAEAGDGEGETAARKGLVARLRLEARTIAEKYIVPGVTVDYAVMYLPTDGLYVEAARVPGLIETLGRENRVLVVGPALLPALVRTVAIGAMSLSIAENAGRIERILGGVRAEFGKIDKLLGSLEKQAGTLGNTLAQTRVRTRAMERQLRTVEVVEGAALALDEEGEEEV